MQSLLAYIRQVGRDGLTPADYDPAGLEAALRSGDPLTLSKAATDRFNSLSSDLALGHVRGDARIDWHVEDKDLDEARQRQMLEAALATNRVPEVLNSLLPAHPQYASLKAALARAENLPDDAATVRRAEYRGLVESLTAEIEAALRKEKVVSLAARRALGQTRPKAADET